MNDNVKQEVIEVLDKHILCVLSTIGPDSKPESAIVGFSYSSGLELLVGTSKQTRKFVNIQANPHVAVVIGDNTAEVQYEGIARHIEETELQGRLQNHFAKVPGASKYRDDPLQAYLLITPAWVRLTVHEETNRVEEVSFV